jgi:hypothetical protein
MGAPVWLNDDDGRIGKLTINPWTGLPVFERITNFEDEAADASVADKSDDHRPDSREAQGSSRSKASSAGRGKSGDSAKRRN